MRLVTTIADFVGFLGFPSFTVEYKPTVLCGISDNFSRQTIWDPMKFFLLQETIRVPKISVSRKTTGLAVYRWQIADSSEFSRYIRFRVCWNNHKGLCGISDNFSRQTIWDPTKFFLLQETIRVPKISVSRKTTDLAVYRCENHRF